MIVTSTAEEARPYTRTLLGGLDGPALSRLAATWPDPLFALFGRGDLRGLSHLALPVTRVESLDDLMNLLTVMSLSVTDRETQIRNVVRTLVIDSLCGLEVLVDFGVEKVGKLMETLCALPVNLVVLCPLAGGLPSVALGNGVARYVDVALNLRGNRLQAWPDDAHAWVVDRSGLLPEWLTSTHDFGHHLEALQRRAPVRARSAERPATLAPPAVPAPTAVGVAPAATALAAMTAPHPIPAAAPAPEAPPAVAPLPAAESAPEPAPVEPEPELEEGELPMCTSKGAQGNECLGQVESDDSLDLSNLRFRRPMCGPCGNAEYEAKPRAVPRKARQAPVAPAPPAGTSRPEDTAMVPRGEVVGRISTGDDALRDFLNG